MRPWILPVLRGVLLAGVVVLIAFIPHLVGEFRLSQFTYVGIYFIALLGLNLLTGYNGQISLGHGAFMAIGGYAASALILGQKGFEALGQHPSNVLPQSGMRPVFAIPLAGLITGIIGYLFGIPALRLAGVSLALATFAVAVSLPALAKRFEHLTGGGGGLSLPLPSTPFGLDVSPSHWLYYEAWICAAVLFVVAWILVRGRLGRAWRSIRDGEIAAVSSGVSPAAYKTLAFGVSAAFAGVAGALFVIQNAYINPDTFPLALSILLLASVVIGGLGSLSGVLVGALVLEFLPIYAQDPPLIHLDFAQGASPVAFGIVLILIVVLLPGGAAGVFRRIGRSLALAGRRVSPTPAAPAGSQPEAP